MGSMDRLGSCARLIAMLTPVVALSACGAPRDVLLRSHAAFMTQAATQLEFATEFEQTLSRQRGGRFVLVDLESNRYVDDDLVNYVIQDVFKGRLAAAYPGMSFLERDPDVLAILRQELTGLEVRKVDRDDGISVPDAQRRQIVGQFLNNIAAGTARSDALAVVAGREGGETVRQSLVSSEIGPNKLALLRDLVREMKELYPVGSAVRDEGLTVEKLQLVNATHLIGFRVYDFGIVTFPPGALKAMMPREAHLRIYLEVVAVESGQVLYSGTSEITLEDEIRKRYESAYAKTKPKPYDFGRPNVHQRTR